MGEVHAYLMGAPGLGRSFGNEAIGPSRPSRRAKVASTRQWVTASRPLAGVNTAILVARRMAATGAPMLPCGLSGAPHTRAR
jgi:hypothetical protein